MKHRLSFADINIISDEIAEVIGNQGIEITLEMTEESDKFLSAKFTNNFALLINRVNQYTYAYEAQLSIASLPHLKAIAVIVYDAQGKESIRSFKGSRFMDKLNIKEFSGLELGRNSAIQWLEHELSNAKVK